LEEIQVYINQNVRVAVIQAASVIMDRDASIEKAVSLIKLAGEKGAKIVVFPEAFIPAYPRGLSFGTIIGSRTDNGRGILITFRDITFYINTFEKKDTSNVFHQEV
jgi:hypothetical protein